MEAVSKGLHVPMPSQKKPCAPRMRIVPPKPRIPKNRAEELRSLAQNPEKGIKWRTLKNAEVVFVISEYMQLNGISSPRELARSSEKFHRIAQKRGLLDRIPFTSLEGHPSFSETRPLVRNPQRSEAEAIVLLEQNPKLSARIVAARNILGNVDRGSAFHFAKISAYKSALRWDGRGEFPSYAVSSSKNVWRMVWEDTESIHIPLHSRMNFMDFRRWRADNPKAKLKEYAKARKISMEEAEFRALNWRMHSGSLHNYLPALIEARGRTSGKQQDEEEVFSELYSTSPFHISRSPHPEHAEHRILKKQMRRAINASLSILTDLQKKVIMMYYGLGRFQHEHNCQEIADELGSTRQNVHQIYVRALGDTFKRPFANGVLEESARVSGNLIHNSANSLPYTLLFRNPSLVFQQALSHQFLLS